jgi:hypothetical protein
VPFGQNACELPQALGIASGAFALSRSN